MLQGLQNKKTRYRSKLVTVPGGQNMYALYSKCLIYDIKLLANSYYFF